MADWPGMFQRVCTTCGASWAGPLDEACAWCASAMLRQIEGQRRLLLHPPWLDDDTGNPRYDELDEIGKAVWRRTRGQHGDEDSIRAWGERLVVAVEVGIITMDEADRALGRAGRGRLREAGAGDQGADSR